jgi:uncharacterized protein (TIGR03435 family)
MRLITTFLWISAAVAQTFDAASIKPALPPGVGPRNNGGPRWQEGMNRLHETASLEALLTEAFGVQVFQIDGPAWTGNTRYLVDAVMPPGTKLEQLRVMMVHLLEERFKLATHRESRSQQVLSLTVAKGGPKMKAVAAVAAALEPTGPEFDTDGFPNVGLFPAGRGSTLFFTVDGRSRLIGQQASMQSLAEELTRRMSRPLNDDTAFSGRYDFVLNFSGGLRGPSASPPVPTEASEPGADLFAALPAQLGLKLDARKGSVEIVVVDHLEKLPTGN